MIAGNIGVPTTEAPAIPPCRTSALTPGTLGSHPVPGARARHPDAVCTGLATGCFSIPKKFSSKVAIGRLVCPAPSHADASTTHQEARQQPLTVGAKGTQHCWTREPVAQDNDFQIESGKQPWLDDLRCLSAKYAPLGFTTDLAAMSMADLLGLYMLLQRIAEGA